MPAIDLARLKKQAVRLADLFDQPAAFLRELHETLDFYVNRTLRTRQTVAPSSVLPAYRTPTLVLRHIETELAPLAAERPGEALTLADELWDVGYFETRLLAAYLLGRIPPQEERLLARLTAWTQKVRDPNVRAALLTTSLARLRKETPERFLTLVKEWLHPARAQHWSNGLQALVPLIADTDFENLPPVFEIVEPVIEAAPTILQIDLEELILALYRKSPTETTYLLRQILNRSQTPLTFVTLRRISPAFPPPLQSSLRELLRAGVQQPQKEEGKITKQKRKKGKEKKIAKEKQEKAKDKKITEEKPQKAEERKVAREKQEKAKEKKVTEEKQKRRQKKGR